MKRTKTRIILERRKVTVVRTAREEQEAFCAACTGYVPMFPPVTAANYAGVSTTDIYREIARQTIHFADTREGLLLICRGSLDAVFNKNNRT